jgi:hypothetical protein
MVPFRMTLEALDKFNQLTYFDVEQEHVFCDVEKNLEKSVIQRYNYKAHNIFVMSRGKMEGRT